MLKDVCRLCHRTFGKIYVETIEETKKEVIQALGLSLDLSRTAEPVACNACRMSLEDMFMFKSKCVYIEDYLTPFLEKEGKLDLKTIHPQIVNAKGDAFETVCRLCFVATNDVITLGEDERRMFLELFPEIDLMQTNSELICKLCHMSLSKYFEFASVCIKNEENINNYFESLKNAEKVNKSLKRKKLFECDECDYKTYQKAYFQKIHIKLHSDRKGLYKCQKCDYSTNTKPTLEIHLTKVHDVPLKKKYKCEKCDYTTNSITYLKKQHMLSHQSTYRTYQCPECPLKTKYHSSLKKHISTKHSDQTLYCFNCPFQTIHKISLVRHMKIHQPGDKLFECDKCDFNTLNKYAMVVHLKEHGLEYSFQCDKCSFKSKLPISGHVCRVRKKRSYMCDICGKKFNSGDTFKLHKLRDHEEGKVKYHECPDCEYRTLYKKHIQKHYKIHTDPDKNVYKCNKCSLLTYSSLYLKKHLVEHHQLDEYFDANSYIHIKHFSMKTFKCAKCSFTSVREKTMKAHEKAHLTFSFVCKLCPYRTDTAKKLDSHKVRHFPPRFKCPHCDYKSKVKSVMRVHMRKHNDHIETYKCAHCPFESKWKISLKNHMNIHLKKMFKCRYCDFETVHRKSQRSHEENVHRKDDHPDYKCASCEFTTKIKASIIQHQLVHKDPSELKMFKCEECPFESKYRRSLRNHIRDIHMTKKKKVDRSDSENEETFECAKCPFKTKKKMYLLRHVIQHRKGREFKCDKCSFATRRRSYLKAHNKVHKVYSEEELAKCPHCDFKTKYARSLKNHISNIHESWEVVEEEGHRKVVSLNG